MAGGAYGLLLLLLPHVYRNVSSTSTSTSSSGGGGSSSSSGDSKLWTNFIICCACLICLYLCLAGTGLFQLIRLLRARYLPRVMIHKAYALLLTVASTCLLDFPTPAPFAARNKRGTPQQAGLRCLCWAR